jgi:hypothetical protein
MNLDIRCSVRSEKKNAAGSLPSFFLIRLSFLSKKPNNIYFDEHLSGKRTQIFEMLQCDCGRPEVPAEVELWCSNQNVLLILVAHGSIRVYGRMTGFPRDFATNLKMQ